MLVPESHVLGCLAQFPEGVPASGVKLERPPHQGTLHGIDLLYLPSLAAIEIAKGCAERIEALLQAAIKSLLRLFAVVADEVRGDDRQDIGREPSSAGGE